MLVACRVLQGLGGAMMVPVGRLILLRSISQASMVTAMVWFSVPPVIGRLLGPLAGGTTVTWFSWRWIFLINIPVGVVAIALAFALIEPGEPSLERRSFDGLGFLLLGVGLAALLAALESAGGHMLDPTNSGELAVFGVLALGAYVMHSRRAAHPLVDLRILRHPTFFAAVIGGLPLRLAIGAMPFLLPLLFQLGFGLSPFDSGLLMMATALGALATRAVLTQLIRRFGFRSMMMGATACTSVCYVLYGQFGASTPHVAVFAVMMVAGLVMSMVMVTLQTLAFSEIPKPLMGHATALSTMVQQASISLGVVLAVELLRIAVLMRGGSTAALQAADFPLAFFSIAGAVLLGIASFRRLPADVGAELRGV
jgi:MFS family permease